MDTVKPKPQELPSLESKRVKGTLEKISFFSILLLVFLLPIFFVPSNVFSIQFTKITLLSIGVILAFAFWLVARLKDGQFVLPKSLVIVSGGILVFVTLLASLFSGSVATSFVGQGFDVGTFASLAILVLLLFLTATLFKSKDKIFYAYIAFFLAFLLIAIFHFVRFSSGSGLLTFQVFTDITTNVIGKWNDLGVFFGLAVLLSLTTLELVSISRFFRFLLYLILLASLVLVGIVNFALVWGVVGLFALVFSVYSMSFRAEKASIDLGASLASRPEEPMVEDPATGAVNRKIPILSLGVLVVSVICLLATNSIGRLVSEKLNINQIEARPTWGTTYTIARKTLADDLLLGVGPNRFVNQWLLNKPDGVNGTIFWNTDFVFGSGFVPTFLVTTGLLGSLAWLLFLGSFLYAGFAAILVPISNRISRYLITSSFLAALFLWIFSVFYTPSSVILALTFIFTGLFIASTREEKLIQTKIISFVDSPQKSFLSVLALILLLILSLASAYFLAERFIAAALFQKAVVTANVAGNLDKAREIMIKAVDLSKTDNLYRFLVDIDLVRMNNLLSQNAGNVSADSLRASFRALLSDALTNAKEAININTTNYENWMTLGRVYEAVVPLRIDGAYDGARSSYLEAMKYNPRSPAILLTLGRLEIAHGDNVKAKEYVIQAIREKNNYTEAIFLLSQIQVDEGNLRDAITSVEAASTLAPNDAGVFFQLGILRYNVRDYSGAVGALERAVTLNPSYANAKYFLGLSYDKVGREKDAIKQFTDLKETNPDNREVELVLKNLKAGRNPFSGATPPIDDRPEKRSKLPI